METNSKQHALSEQEQAALRNANTELVVAKAQGYDALQALEAAQKAIALAEAKRQTALNTIASAHGVANGTFAQDFSTLTEA